MNDNIIFEKVWQEGELIELKITAVSVYASVFQYCYIEKTFLEKLSKLFKDYMSNYDKECYIEFGEKEGNFTPAFSMKLLPADYHGHVKIEVDLEIADNDLRQHRCCFYVNTELGMIERLIKNFNKSLDMEVGWKCSLYTLD